MTNGELISLLRDLSTEEKVAQLCQVDMKEFADGLLLPQVQLRAEENVSLVPLAA